MFVRDFLFEDNEMFKMKKICLGSALWGWSVNKKEVFKLLDLYYSEGYRYIDMAWNYPINGLENKISAKHFLAEWLKINKINDVKIIYKVGSVCHRRTEENDLSDKNLTEQIYQSLDLFGENISSVMIHWDNRLNFVEINMTCSFLSYKLKELNLLIGLSGIQDVDSYFRSLVASQKKVYIQVKSNFLYQDEEKYKIFNDKIETNYFAYGISMGGVKPSKSEYTIKSNIVLSKMLSYHDLIVNDSLLQKYESLKREHYFIENFYHASMYNIESNKAVYGYIVAPTSVEQMLDILRFRNAYINEKS